MTSVIDFLVESIYLHDNVFKFSLESVKIWSMKFGKPSLCKRLEELP